MKSIPFDKLLHITDNLCKTNRKRADRDLSSLFIKSMFSDGLLENDMIHKAILSADCPESIDELFKVKIGSKMLTVVEKINEKMV